jgi:hypothetical protein
MATVFLDAGARAFRALNIFRAFHSASVETNPFFTNDFNCTRKNFCLREKNFRLEQRLLLTHIFLSGIFVVRHNIFLENVNQ